MDFLLYGYLAAAGERIRFTSAHRISYLGLEGLRLTWNASRDQLQSPLRDLEGLARIAGGTARLGFVGFLAPCRCGETSRSASSGCKAADTWMGICTHRRSGMRLSAHWG